MTARTGLFLYCAFHGVDLAQWPGRADVFCAPRPLDTESIPRAEPAHARQPLAVVPGPASAAGEGTADRGGRERAKEGTV
jgi:hypothetical protein